MKIAGIFFCSAKPGFANLDVLNLFSAMSEHHNISLFLLSEWTNSYNIKSYPIKPLIKLFGHKIYNPFFVLPFLVKIIAIKPDIVVSDTVFFISIPVYFINTIIHKPLVMYCRELVLEITPFINSPLRSLRRSMLRNADAVIAVDNGLKEYMQKETGEKVHLIPASINFDNFVYKNIRTGLNLPSGHKLILYLGRIFPDRGLDLLIESFSMLKDEDITLVLRGISTDKSMNILKLLIHKHNVDNRVIILPEMPYSLIPSLIYSCDICVDPFARQGVEEFQVGLKILEYMAAGKPVLAIDVQGNRQIIEHGYNGLLSKPDIKEFSSCMSLLVDDASLSHSLGNNARNTIASNYSSKSVAAMFEELLNTIISKDKSKSKTELAF